MKRVMKTVVLTLAGLMAALATSQAQVQQSINVSLTLYNQTDTGIRTLHISNRDIIQNLTGTNVSGGKLWLVMPSDPSPDGSGNIGAFLRVTDSRNNILAETDTSTFNIYQTFQSQTATRTVAFNQFSFDFGGFGAELYGTATWSKSASGGGGQGSFHCSVGGRAALGGVTSGAVPATGSISGSSPRPAQ